MIEKFRRLFYKIRDYKFAQNSYAQEGEDLLLKRIFESDSTGYYIDVGAHHPKRFSNTYLFYLKGWHGINIDAMPGSMVAFNKIRPKDINIEAGVSATAQTLTYYMFEEAAYNGFDRTIAENNRSSKLSGKIKIKTLPLSSLLDNYLPLNQVISFLSVDVEGLDLEVLQSNDWEKYRPQIVLVEILEAKISNVFESDIHQFLTEKGYTFYCKSPNTVFYKKSF